MYIRKRCSVLGNGPSVGVLVSVCVVEQLLKETSWAMAACPQACCLVILILHPRARVGPLRVNTLATCEDKSPGIRWVSLGILAALGTGTGEHRSSLGPMT